MRTVIKVFFYIYIILFSFLAALFLVLALFPIPYAFLLFIYVLIFLIPVIVDVIGLKKLNNAVSKDELLAISIVVLIFGGLIPGILMLCANEDDLLGIKRTQVKTTQTIKEDKKEDITTKLEKLKKLKDNGTITENEFNELRKQVIDNYKG